MLLSYLHYVSIFLPRLEKKIKGFKNKAFLLTAKGFALVQYYYFFFNHSIYRKTAFKYLFVNTRTH